MPEAVRSVSPAGKCPCPRAGVSLRVRRWWPVFVVAAGAAPAGVASASTLPGCAPARRPPAAVVVAPAVRVVREAPTPDWTYWEPVEVTLRAWDDRTEL